MVDCEGSGAVLPSPPIVLWVKDRDSYVNRIQNVNLRVKNSSKFGENLRGFADGRGELVEMNWEGVMKLRPTVLEVNNSRNPFDQLVSALDNITDEQLSDFFSRLKFLSFNMTNAKSEHLLKLLGKLNLLEAFSFCDVHYGKEDWRKISSEFVRLNTRALDISSDVLDCLLSNVDVELLKFSGSPGLSIAHLHKATSPFVSVRALAVQELNYTNEQDAEQFLDCVAEKFPRLSVLLWDWSVVDPAISVDDRSKTIIQKLVKTFQSLSLGLLCVIAYTPCGETKHAAGELARLLGDQLPHVQLHSFYSKGLSGGEPNFSVIVAGENLSARDTVLRIYVEGRNSIPNLGHLLPLIGAECSSFAHSLIADFGGFDTPAIKKDFASKKWDNNIEL